MEARKLLICGTRTYAEEISDVASDIPGVEVVGFVENWERDRCKDTLEGLPIHWIDDQPKVAKGCVAVCALMTTHRSKFTAQVDAYGVPFATIIHPAAIVSKRSVVGEGTVVAQGSIIGSHARIGRHVLFGRGALVGHRTHIGDFCSVITGCNIAGNNRIGDACYISMGSIIINNLNVGALSVIGAGAVVVKDVPARSQVVGVPARVVKENIDGK